MKNPEIGLLICNSGSSNSGTLTGMACIELLKELGGDDIGILSLPALANQVPRQTLIAKRMKHILIIDGCSNSCAKNIAEKSGLPCTHYLNLEDDLRIQKSGPFSTLAYSSEDVAKVKEAIKEMVILMKQLV
jgi:uncharacterized metal-binding protein